MSISTAKNAQLPEFHRQLFCVATLQEFQSFTDNFDNQETGFHSDGDGYMGVASFEERDQPEDSHRLKHVTDLSYRVVTDKFEDLFQVAVDSISTTSTLDISYRQSLFFFADFSFILTKLLAIPSLLKSLEEQNPDQLADFLVLGVLRGAFAIFFNFVSQFFNREDFTIIEFENEVLRWMSDPSRAVVEKEAEIFGKCLQHMETITVHLSTIFPRLVDDSLPHFATPAIRETIFWIFDTCFELFAPNILHNQRIISFFGPLARIVMRITFTDAGEQLFCNDHFVNNVLMKLLVNASDREDMHYVIGVIRNICYKHGQHLLANETAVHAIVTALNASATPNWLDNVAGLVGNLCTGRPDMQKMFFDHPNFFSAYHKLPFARLSVRQAVVVESSFCVVLQAAPTTDEGFDLMTAARKQPNYVPTVLNPFHPYDIVTHTSRIVAAIDELLKEGDRCVQLMGNPYFLKYVAQLQPNVSLNKEMYKDVLKKIRDEVGRTKQ